MLINYYKNLSIELRIMIALIGVAVISSGVTGWIGFHTAYTAMERDAHHSAKAEVKLRQEKLALMIHDLRQNMEATLDYALSTCQGPSVGPQLACKRILQQLLATHSGVNFATERRKNYT